MQAGRGRLHLGGDLGALDGDAVRWASRRGLRSSLAAFFRYVLDGLAQRSGGRAVQVSEYRILETALRTTPPLQRMSPRYRQGGRVVPHSPKGARKERPMAKSTQLWPE